MPAVSSPVSQPTPVCETVMFRLVAASLLFLFHCYPCGLMKPTSCSSPHTSLSSHMKHNPGRSRPRHGTSYTPALSGSAMVTLWQ
jgi:hypothetical protein